MTPTEQDKELREKLLNLRITVWKQTNLNGQANLDHDSVNEILQLITADRKRVALEARIDELSAIYGWSQEERTPLIFYPEHRSSDFAQMATNGMGTNFTVRERIAELKAQQEEV